MSQREVENRRPQPYADDEISLVDLAITFIRRRKVFYLTFGVVFVLGLIYALLLPEKYGYASLVRLAEVEAGEYLQAPAVVIANLESRWVPELKTVYREAEGEKLPFELAFENPANTGLIRIASEAVDTNTELVKESHEQLIQHVLEEQNAQLENYKRSLKSRIQAVETAIEQLKGGQDTGVALAAAYEKKVELEGKLESLQEGEALVVSRQSAEEQGRSRALVLVLSVVLGGVLGVFMAFIAEFGAVVQRSIAHAHSK